MADGFNQIRAFRIAEIIHDFRNIQSCIAAIRANPSAEEYNEEGYVLLRRCVAEAQALLARRFAAQHECKGDEEEDRMHLRRIIADAAVRRFQAQKIYLRAMAAVRWINARVAVLQGQRAHAGHAPALQQVRNNFRTELASLTDQRVDLSLRSPDAAAGKWLLEDPSLAVIQRLAANFNNR